MTRESISRILDAYEEERRRFDGYKGPIFHAIKELVESGELKPSREHELREAIRLTIMENLHLADGDDCTLKRLKDAIGFELPDED